MNLRWYQVHDILNTNGSCAKVVKAPCVCLAGPAPSSSFIEKPQEHGRAGLLKPQNPDTFYHLAIKLRDGGIHTKFHSRGRVQLAGRRPKNLLPRHFDRPARTPHLPPFSARSQHQDPAPRAFDRPRRDAPTL